MRKKITYLLRLAGLKEQEIKLYLHLLKLRQATMPELVAKSGLNHMTVYRAIGNLLERGLIHTAALNNKQDSYLPLSLKKLAETIAAQQRKLRRLELSLRGLDKLLPFLDLETEEESHENIEVKEGLLAFREEYLKLPDLCQRDYLHLGCIPNYWDISGIAYESDEERDFIHRRISNGVFVRALNTPSPEMDVVCQRDIKEKRSTRLRSEIPITRNYLAITETQASHFICDREHPRVIIIRQPDLLAMHKQEFYSLWTSTSGSC